MIAKQANVRYVPNTSHCIAQYDTRDILMGGVLFTDWNMGSIQVHMALWGGFGALRPLIYLVFQYAFVQLDVKKVFGLVPEWNTKARQMNQHLGFRVEYLAEDVFSNPDGVNGMYLMSMRKADCRWLTMKCPPIEYAPKLFSRPIGLVDMPVIGPMQ